MYQIGSLLSLGAAPSLGGYNLQRKYPLDSRSGIMLSSDSLIEFLRLPFGFTAVEEGHL